ncbi:MAG: DNA mismatch repair protein [Eubacterium sp.]|nr:DNA mismatch repair protein [Eubacterium sp.]
MKGDKEFSLLYPRGREVEFKKLEDGAFHDLGLDVISKAVASEPKEQEIVAEILSFMTPDPDVTNYRQDVFEDIKRLPDIRAKIAELFEKIEFNRQFGVIRKSKDEVEGLWLLMHRLGQYRDYITCVDALKECLGDGRIRSKGLKDFKAYIDEVYADAHFNELKKDLERLSMETSEIQSVTLGLNLNSRLEAVSMGIVSINNKPFKKAGIVSSFAEGISHDKIKDGNEWNGDMHYRLVDKNSGPGIGGFISDMLKHTNPVLASTGTSTMTSIPKGDGLANAPAQFDVTLNKMLDSIAKSLRRTLDKYADMALYHIADVIPEFVYYIRFAEFMTGLEEKGFRFTKAGAVIGGDNRMRAKGFYNFKLALNLSDPKELVENDLDFDSDHTIYILTGANRGGKTTSTQAVGLLFALAQGGIPVPADSFEFEPVDCIFTHFPADEDKTVNLGRLGEECIRFKEIFNHATAESLILMNETFSTTSFEEGYYIACDAIRALLTRNVRTIYNTHMHKLGVDAEEFSKNFGQKASSLIVKSDGGNRSFKLAVAPPEGSSYASDIAKKYGVTYDILVGEKNMK